MFDSLLSNPAVILLAKIVLAIAIAECVLQLISHFKVWLYQREVIAEVKRSLKNGESAEEIHRKCTAIAITRTMFMLESAKDGHYSVVNFALDRRLMALMEEDYDVLDAKTFVERYSQKMFR